MSSTSGSIESDPHLERRQKADAALAALSEAFSRALWTPREMTGEEPEALRAIPAETLGPAQASVAALADAWEAALADRTALSIAFAKLFLGPFEILAPPYASFYLEPDQRIMGQVSNMVAEIYAEAGLKPGPGPREAPDHAALEWEFVYFLAHQSLVTDDDAWRHRRARFVADHLSRWMPDFCAAITRASAHPFYDAWAACVIASLPRFRSQDA